VETEKAVGCCVSSWLCQLVEQAPRSAAAFRFSPIMSGTFGIRVTMRSIHLCLYLARRRLWAEGHLCLSLSNLAPQSPCRYPCRPSSQPPSRFHSGRRESVGLCQGFAPYRLKPTYPIHPLEMFGKQGAYGTGTLARTSVGCNTQKVALSKSAAFAPGVQPS
jgi:hypothetical protein